MAERPVNKATEPNTLARSGQLHKHTILHSQILVALDHLRHCLVVNHCVVCIQREEWRITLGLIASAIAKPVWLSICVWLAFYVKD